MTNGHENRDSEPGPSFDDPEFETLPVTLGVDGVETRHPFIGAGVVVGGVAEAFGYFVDGFIVDGVGIGVGRAAPWITDPSHQLIGAAFVPVRFFVRLIAVRLVVFVRVGHKCLALPSMNQQ